MSIYENDLAEQILAATAIDKDAAARLILELLETTGEISNPDSLSVLNHCRAVIQRGAEHYAADQHTLPFYKVVEENIRAKMQLRDRTLSEIRQYSQRIIKNLPHLKNHPLRQFTPDVCRHAVETSFHTTTMRIKAYKILQGIFNFGVKRGLCQDNPIYRLEIPRKSEQRVEALSIEEIRRLLETALKPEHLACAPALGIMLWTGIRPTEVERITWSHINIKDRIIDIEPSHSKTGGARQVTIQPILARWLRKVCIYTPSNLPITPRAWTKRWRSLRRDAGFKNWQADILRHTFASYHLRYFRDLGVLQLEMGHSSADLLRTRYLSMKGITDKTAKKFWEI